MAQRAYRLTEAEAAVVNAGPWSDAACVRHGARVALFMRRLRDPVDAYDLAERLHLRDMQGDERRLCVECRHLTARRMSGWRCGNAVAAGVASDLPAELVTVARRCPGFEVCPSFAGTEGRVGDTISGG